MPQRSATVLKAKEGPMHYQMSVSNKVIIHYTFIWEVPGMGFNWFGLVILICMFKAQLDRRTSCCLNRVPVRYNTVNHWQQYRAHLILAKET